MTRRSPWYLLGAVVVVGVVALVLLVLPATQDPEPTGAPAGTTTSASPTTATPSPSSRPSRRLRPAAVEPGVTITPAPVTTSEPPTPSAGPSPSGVVAAHRVFPVGGCDGQYAATHHDYPAADIFTGADCTFVSPVDGRVDEVGYQDSWDPSVNDGSTRGGLFVSVVGADGVRYYGAHLAAVASGIQPGTTVTAGQSLGRIGDTGSARGTGIHLHFGISWPTPPGYWWIRRGVVAPQPYLDSWRQGGDASPVEEIADARREYGDDSRCRAYC